MTLIKKLRNFGITLTALGLIGLTSFNIGKILNQNYEQRFEDCNWLKTKRKEILWDSYINEKIPHNQEMWHTYINKVREYNRNGRYFDYLPDLDGNGVVY